MRCYCVKLCGWFLKQIAMSTEDQGGDYNHKHLHDGYNLIKW